MKIIQLILVSVVWVSFLMTQEKLPSRDLKEWNELTVAQRWQAVNIPEDQLSKMTTDELIEHCINFDFMWDIFNYPDYEMGLNVVIKHYNGVRELLNRKDAGKLILNFYRNIELSKVIEIDNLVDRGEYVGRIFFLNCF